MRKLLTLIVIMTALIIMTSGSILAEEAVNNAYKMKISEYYEVSLEDVNAIIDTSRLLEEIPVVFFMAQQTKRAPSEILGIIKGGSSWSNFMKQNNIPQSSVLVKIQKFETAECKAILKKLKNIPLNKVEFAKEDIIILVNYGFLSDSYKVKLDEIIKYRDAEQDNFKTFMDINSLLSKNNTTEQKTKKAD